MALWTPHPGAFLTTPTIAATALLHFDGANGATTTTDVYGHAVTATSVQLSTSEAKFGSASSNNTSATFGSGWQVGNGSTDFQFGTNPFTLDFWLWPTAADYTSAAWALGIGTDAAGVAIRTQFTGKIDVYFNATNNAGSTSGITNGAWNHVAVTRSGANLYLFINGVLDASAPFNVGAGASQTSTEGLIIGGNASGSSAPSLSTSSFIDEVRVIKGTAYWTASFTPPSLPWAA